ncbi:hypothetical protein BJF90_27190 [Pseudonocardia sp. CNS-004]|nr:hypothetical protein BJF90_27190 [Pseudonocardia sp. CNS-004]
MRGARGRRSARGVAVLVVRDLLGHGECRIDGRRVEPAAVAVLHAECRRDVPPVHERVDQVHLDEARQRYAPVELG